MPDRVLEQDHINPRVVKVVVGRPVLELLARAVDIFDDGVVAGLVLLAVLDEIPEDPVPVELLVVAASEVIGHLLVDDPVLYLDADQLEEAIEEHAVEFVVDQRQEHAFVGYGVDFVLAESMEHLSYVDQVEHLGALARDGEQLLGDVFV